MSNFIYISYQTFEFYDIMLITATTTTTTSTTTTTTIITTTTTTISTTSTTTTSPTTYTLAVRGILNSIQIQLKSIILTKSPPNADLIRHNHVPGEDENG